MTKILLLLTLLVLLAGCSSASASPASKVVTGLVSNVASTVFKWLWSLKSPTKTAVSSPSMMKFESGYTVETVFDGSKLGIEPYSVQVTHDGEVLILDSENSNIHRISTPISRYSRPKLVAGSAEGHSGHVDGKFRESRLNHPKGLTIDDSGNLYIADTLNMAIRKITETGVVTIAGGRIGRESLGRHVDGPSEDARFSNDFDVIYVQSSCSLLVVDRGNQAIREIQLQEDDCSSTQEDANLHLGIAVLAAACLFGYILAILQRWIGAMLSYNSDSSSYSKSMPPAPAPQRKHITKSVRPPLIPTEDDYEKQEEGLFTSMGKLFANTGSSILELFGGLFSGFRKKAPAPHTTHHAYQHPSRHTNSWPLQESFVIPNEDEPPPLDPRDPTPRRSYPFMPKEMDHSKPRQSKQSRTTYYNNGGWNGEFQQQQPHRHVQQLQHHQMHQPSSSQTIYEQQNCETNEIVFGAVQEEGAHREAVVIKAMDFADPSCYSNSNSHNVRSRYNYMSYSSSSSYGY